MKYARFLQQQIPGAEIARIPGAGHMVMLEAPTAMARLLEAFLATLP